jgi:hypothetical protein
MTDGSRAAVRFAVLAYGADPRLHREAVTSLLTIRQFAPAGAEVLVFTDQPSLFAWLASEVGIERLSAEVIKQWRGPANDRFRPKIETLRHLTADGSHALLADSDTMARASLAPLADHLRGGGFILHEREYSIAAPPRRGDRSLAREILHRRWGGIVADAHTWMWNGGVIGVSGHHRGVVDRTLDAFDQMRTASKHFALEQLAYSIVFPAYGPIRAASDCFIHYWANRAWFDRRIDRFLAMALLHGLTARSAGEALRAQPIEGALDGRPSSWQRRVKRLFHLEMDDDVERIG